MRMGGVARSRSARIFTRWAVGAGSCWNLALRSNDDYSPPAGISAKKGKGLVASAAPDRSLQDCRFQGIIPSLLDFWCALFLTRITERVTVRVKHVPSVALPQDSSFIY
jgi:hypothetical protein